MKTLYEACLSRLGLSKPAAAILHGLPLDTIKGWASGRRATPRGIWSELRAYSDAIEERRASLEDMLDKAMDAAGEAPATMPVRLGDDPRALMSLAAFALTAEIDPAIITLSFSGRPETHDA